MGYYCTVPQCTSLAGKTKNVKFHRFPRDEPMANKWNMILKRGKPITKYSKVCSLHFTQADYNVTTMGQWKTLSKDAVPSQNLPKLNPDGTVMVIRKSRTVKYRDGKKEENIEQIKSEKWPMSMQSHSIPSANTPEGSVCSEAHDSNLAYRLQTLNSIANNIAPSHTSPQAHVAHVKPKKQDAIMQTDPVASEEDDSQPNNSYNEVSEKSYSSELEPYQYPKDGLQKSFEPKDYTKTDDYIPQTNEEYNKEAEKYALERKSLNGYEKLPDNLFQKPVMENGFQKIPELYPNYEKPYQRTDFIYQNGFPDSADVLRNQQHNLQMLQEQHRIMENQNFFNKRDIKQEIENVADDDKYMYERMKEPIDSNPMYDDSQRRLINQQRLLEHIQHQVKQEPDTANGCENVMQPQSSPYYATNGHNNVTGNVYYESLPRPGPELLIAKQNALAAHTQLWQNAKRPFIYSDSPHYNSTPILHRYEDFSRIIQ